MACHTAWLELVGRAVDRIAVDLPQAMEPHHTVHAIPFLQRSPSMRQIRSSVPGYRGWLQAAFGLLTAACSDAAGPDSARELATTFEIRVVDSLGTGLGGVPVTAQGWIGDAPLALQQVDPFFATHADGRVSFRWPEPEPAEYDSVTFAVSEMPCRPYAAASTGLAAAALRGLPGDSLRRDIALGLAVSAPPLTPSTLCAAAEKTFGAIRLTLQITSLASVADDSIRGEWEIVFRESSALSSDAVAGVVRNDSLVLQLRIAPPDQCAPGYVLRAALLGGEIGPAAFDALDTADPLCSQTLLNALHFVPVGAAQF